MNNEQAIKVLLDEWKCIDRNDGINCDRQCEKCDLVMDSAILKDAYNMAIKALSQEPPTFNWVQNRVDLAKAEIKNAIESTFCTKDEAIGLGVALNVIDKYFTI